MAIDKFANETPLYQMTGGAQQMLAQDRRYMPAEPRSEAEKASALAKLLADIKAQQSRLLTNEEMAQPDVFTPDQRELRQLLAVKLRALALEVEGHGSTRPAHAGEIRRAVDRLKDIAGAME